MWVDLAVVGCILAAIFIQTLMLLLLARKTVTFQATLHNVQAHVTSLNKDHRVRHEETNREFDILSERLLKRAETFIANHNASDGVLVGVRAGVEELNKRLFAARNDLSDMQDGIEELLERTEAKRGRKKQPNRKTP